MASKKVETEALVKATDTSIIPHSYSQHQGLGFEGQGKDDVTIPMVKILQGLSPEVNQGKGRPGDFYNTVTEQVWEGSKGIVVVPALTKHMFGKWTPRDEGGGFHGNVMIDDPVVLQAKKESIEFGKYTTVEQGKTLTLRECHYVFGALCDEDGNPESPVCLPFAGTKIKPYKAWNTRMKFAILKDASGNRIFPPMFAHRVRITSLLENKKGNQFFVPVIISYDRRGIPASLLAEDDPAFRMGESVYQMMISGDAKVNYGAESGDESDAGSVNPETGLPF